MSVIEFKPSEPDAPFVIGSVVKLKSGGEPMTVRKVGKQSINVDWHNSDGEPIREDYPPAMLMHANPDDEKDAPDGGR